MPFPHKNKNPAAGITSKRQDFLTKKGISTANPSYVPRRLFFLISCIYYTRFSGIRKFLPDFFSETKALDFFQGKMHFSSQIFQFFTNHFFRIFIIFGFRIKIDNFSGFRNFRDYLAFFVVISVFQASTSQRFSSSSKKSHRISVHLLFFPVLSFRSFLISLTIP